MRAGVSGKRSQASPGLLEIGPCFTGPLPVMEGMWEEVSGRVLGSLGLGPAETRGAASLSWVCLELEG